jgi:hypothetical protein
VLAFYLLLHAEHAAGPAVYGGDGETFTPLPPDEGEVDQALPLPPTAPALPPVSAPPQLSSLGVTQTHAGACAADLVSSYALVTLAWTILEPSAAHEVRVYENGVLAGTYAAESGEHGTTIDGVANAPYHRTPVLVSYRVEVVKTDDDSVVSSRQATWRGTYGQCSF